MICKARDNSRPSLKRKTIWSPKFKHNWTTKRHIQAQTCRTWFQGQAWITVSQQARQPMFDHSWAIVDDAGPTLIKNWVDVSCLLG